MTVATGKLAKLFKLSNYLICIHGSRKAVTSGPPALPMPNIKIMLSTVNTYLRAVTAVNETVVVAAMDTADQHQPLSIVVYTIIAIGLMVYTTLNLCKIVF